MSLNLTPSAEAYLIQLGDHKLIRDGLKQKTAVSQVFWQWSVTTTSVTARDTG